MECCFIWETQFWKKHDELFKTKLLPLLNIKKKKLNEKGKLLDCILYFFSFIKTVLFLKDIYILISLPLVFLFGKGDQQ